MLLIDKYRPTTLKDAYFNIDVLNLLEIMSQDDAIPHIIFYGPEGAGKRTTVKMFLEMLYDKNVHKTKNVTYKVVGSGNKKTDEIVKQSEKGFCNFLRTSESSKCNIVSHIINQRIYVDGRSLFRNFTFTFLFLFILHLY